MYFMVFSLLSFARRECAFISKSERGTASGHGEENISSLGFA
jgi:hypothetical protein